MTEWNKDKEKKVLRKYRFILVSRIIGVLLLIGIVYSIYTVAVTIIYDQSDLASKYAYHTNLVIDWTQPGLEGDFGVFPNSTISPLLTQSIDYPVYERVGKGKKAVGELKINKGLLSSQHYIDYYEPVEGSRFQFYLPEDPRTGKALAANEPGDAWNSLDKVHEGTVATMGFSTKNYFTPLELFELLEPYDLEVLWMPIYAGELKDFEVGTMSSTNLLAVDHIGLTHARHQEGDDYRSYGITLLSKETVEENQEIMLSSMKKLLDHESESYIKDFLRLWYLEERYEYLTEHGFHVYGAVVTGPVKELLKLREVDEIQGAHIGEFDYWNWDSYYE